MIHWTDIEKSKEGILKILEVIKNYEKDGEVRFIAGIQGRHFSEYKIQQLICIVRERLNMTRRELLLKFRIQKFSFLGGTVDE